MRSTRHHIAGERHTDAAIDRHTTAAVVQQHTAAAVESSANSNAHHSAYHSAYRRTDHYIAAADADRRSLHGAARLLALSRLRVRARQLCGRPALRQRPMCRRSVGSDQSTRRFRSNRHR
jgi:hypothetical protein